jgi:hypothetical protein
LNPIESASSAKKKGKKMPGIEDFKHNPERMDLLPEYLKWLETIPPHLLRQYIQDAWVKDQIKDLADLHRFFLLHRKGVDMIPRPVKPTPPPGRLVKER